MNFASAFLAPGECYLVTVGIDNISQNSSIRSGGMEDGDATGGGVRGKRRGDREAGQAVWLLPG